MTASLVLGLVGGILGVWFNAGLFNMRGSLPAILNLLIAAMVIVSACIVKKHGKTSGLIRIFAGAYFIIFSVMFLVSFSGSHMIGIGFIDLVVSVVIILSGLLGYRWGKKQAGGNAIAAGCCLRCGSPLAPGNAFCIKCGNPVSAGGAAVHAPKPGKTYIRTAICAAALVLAVILAAVGMGGLGRWVSEDLGSHNRIELRFRDDGLMTFRQGTYTDTMNYVITYESRDMIKGYVVSAQDKDQVTNFEMYLDEGAMIMDAVSHEKGENAQDWAGTITFNRD